VEKDLVHPLKKALIRKVSKLNLEKNLTAYDKLLRQQKILVLAGIFDGEGSFGVWSRGKNRKDYCKLRSILVMQTWLYVFMKCLEVFFVL
jgi:hypothetical protein